MKTRIFVVMTLVVIFLVSGCGGQRHATLKDKEGMIITHDDSNISLLEPSIGPIEMAEAYRIKKQADIIEKMMNDLKEGKAVTAPSGQFLIGIINNDPRIAVYIYHPEIPSMKLIIDPRGGFSVFPVRDIPYNIILYSASGRIIKRISPRHEPNYQEKIAHKKLVGNLLVDYKITIARVND